MRRLPAFAILLYLGSVLFASPASVEDDIRWFRALESREDGSSGEARSLDYIAEHLNQTGIRYDRMPLGGRSGGHSFSENLIARIPGVRDGTIILAAPVDGGAFSMALLLSLASEMKVNPPRHNFVLAFLGAEKGDSAYHPYGSRTAASDAAGEPGVLALYIDSENVPDNWQIRPGGDMVVTPFWLTMAITRVFSSRFIPFSLRGTDIQVSRLGLQGDIGALAPWIESDIPAVMLTGDGLASGSDRYRMITRFSESITELDAQLDDIPDNLQSSYVFIHPLSGLRPRLIPELPTVVVILSIAAILLIIILARYRDVSLNIRRFAPYWWTWPLLFLLVFLFFFLSTLFVEETLLLSDFPELWQYASGVFIFFKLFIAAALSLNFILITRGLPLPRSPHYYSYAAIMTSGIATLVFMALDITLALYSMWAIVMLLLLTATRNERLKIFLLFLSAVPYLMGLAVIIREPYDILIRSILLDRIPGNLILTLILMPLILGITSLNYWQMHYHRIRRNVLTPTATLILNILAIITLTWILNIEPFGPNRPQPVKLIDRIDLSVGDRRLAVSSPAPIGDATLTLDGIEYHLEDLGRRAEVRTPLNRTPLRINHRSRTFLGRRIITVLIEGDRNPETLNVSLQSDSPFTLHDADVPFEVSSDGTLADLFIGANPPFPLTLRFTVNDEADLNLSCIAIWNDPLDPPGISRKDLSETTSRVVHLKTIL